MPEDNKYVMVPLEELNELRWKYKTAVEALVYIRNFEGKVCSEFADCTHEGCNSSFNAFNTSLITVERLGGIENVNQFIENYSTITV